MFLFVCFSLCNWFICVAAIHSGIAKASQCSPQHNISNLGAERRAEETSLLKIETKQNETKDRTVSLIVYLHISILRN